MLNVDFAVTTANNVVVSCVKVRVMGLNTWPNPNPNPSPLTKPGVHVAREPLAIHRATGLEEGLLEP